MGFEHGYEDVLQNIESAIIEVYRRDATLLDYDVADALDALVRVYRAEDEHHSPPVFQMSNKPRQVFDSAKDRCEFWLRRSSAEQPPELVAPVGIEEIIGCLKQIRKSVQRWTKANGRRGYLDFVSKYV